MTYDLPEMRRDSDRAASQLRTFRRRRAFFSSTFFRITVNIHARVMLAIKMFGGKSASVIAALSIVPLAVQATA